MLTLRNDKAFDAFFTDRVEVSSPRPSGDVGGAFRCIIDHGGIDATMGEESSVADRQSISVTIPRTGAECWDDFTFGGEPRIGDKVLLPDLSCWGVKEVKKDAAAYYLICREARKGVPL